MKIEPETGKPKDNSLSAVANRQAALATRSKNLHALFAHRFGFAARHLPAGARVLEVGSGIGLSQQFLPHVEVTMTDVEWNPWLSAVVSSETLAFADGSFDAVLCFEVLHHLAQPAAALREFGRIVRPGGVIVLHEPHGSLLLRLLLRLTGHEYFDPRVDVFGAASCQRGENNWDGNNAIPDLLFADTARFERQFPDLAIVHQRLGECGLFVNSGGVNRKTPYVPLPGFALDWMAAVDSMLCRLAPDVFALAREIVIERRR